MHQAKRVGKVLQAVPESSHWLVCNTDLEELNLVGMVAHDGWLSNSIGIRFRKGDAHVFVGGEQVCKIRDGEFVAAGNDIGLDKLKGALRHAVGKPCDSLYEFVKAISDIAIQAGHGCTVVLDFREPLAELSGQRLVTPLTLSREGNSLSIAAAMSSIDGALHIDSDGQLLAFGCLLDGNRVDDERLDRGARYNSALRFAKRTDIKVVAVVVSEDGLLSVFSRGGEYSGEPQLVSLRYIIPAIPLAEWFDSNPAQ